MQVFFCTACEAGLVFGDQRCDHCGEILGAAQSPQTASGSPPTRLARIGTFFESQAGLSLTTLLIFLGLGIALVPVSCTYARMQQVQVRVPVPVPAPGAGAKPAAGAPVKCSGLKVFFAEMATVGEVMTLLDPLDVGLVSGPDPAGAFRLSAPAQTLPAVAASLGQAEDTVAGVFIEPQCAPS